MRKVVPPEAKMVLPVVDVHVGELLDTQVAEVGQGHGKPGHVTRPLYCGNSKITKQKDLYMCKSTGLSKLGLSPDTLFC